MTEKKTYKKPVINKIEIDNEISLIMMTGESDPPGGPWDNGGDGSNNDDSKDKNRESPFKR
jgi:hypothetical protein